MKGIYVRLLSVLLLLQMVTVAMANDSTKLPRHRLTADPDNGGLKLPKGFGGIVITPDLGRNRHLVVNSNGDIYVKLDRLKNGKGIMVLHEDSTGKAQVINSFGNFTGT